MCAQVVRPRIPYNGAIPGGLHDGKLIEVKGTAPYGAHRFEVNLATGLDSAFSDLALHLSVRFDGRVVVRNSRERGEWGTEERAGHFPFSSGAPFTIMIMTDLNCYRIAVNGSHCYEFRHSLSITRVNSVFIDGSVQIEKLEFFDKTSPYRPGPAIPTYIIPEHNVTSGFLPSMPATFPTPSLLPTCPTMPGTCIIPPPESVMPSPGGRSDLAPVYNPPIPYAYPIYGGLRPGMMVYISGRPSASAYRFTLNFQSGTSPYPPPDICFHMDVRFFNRTVVRNSRSGNQWGHEETQIPIFTFQPGVHFDIVIRIEANRYMVALNGQHLLEFRNRLSPLSRFDTLYIENDVVISSIRFA